MSIDHAPDWPNSDYPSKGERIGPAWQKAWDLMADGQWRRASDVAAVAAEYAGVLPKTVINMIRAAGKHRFIDYETRGNGRFKRAWCRRWTSS